MYSRGPRFAGLLAKEVRVGGFFSRSSARAQVCTQLVIITWAHMGLGTNSARSPLLFGRGRARGAHLAGLPAVEVHVGRVLLALARTCPSATQFIVIRTSTPTHHATTSGRLASDDQSMLKDLAFIKYHSTTESHRHSSIQALNQHSCNQSTPHSVDFTVVRAYLGAVRLYVFYKGRLFAPDMRVHNANLCIVYIGIAIASA